MIDLVESKDRIGGSINQFGCPEIDFVCPEIDFGCPKTKLGTLWTPNQFPDPTDPFSES